MNPEHTSTKPSLRAVVLISGGLDSALAAALVKSWGIEVIALHLTSPFGCTTDAEKVANDLGIPLIVKPKGESFVDLVNNPKYGYGSQMNPCIDCRIYMFELAEQVRLEENADFIVTGEVVGQRPLSQNKASMKLIDRKSPLEEKVLRPLSGGNLPPTQAEQMGWIKRENLLKLSGRGRSEQLALAKQLGLNEYTSPGGGCLLTEKAFSDRLRDFYSNPTYTTPEQKMAQASLLRLGRHFKLTKTTKVIIARTATENQELLNLWATSGAILFKPSNFMGPSAIALGQLKSETMESIAALVARYGKRTDNSPYQVESHASDEQNRAVKSLWTVLNPIPDETLNQWRIGIT